MTRAVATFLLAIAVAGAVFAQPAPSPMPATIAPATPPVDPAGLVRVRLETGAGPIVLEIDRQHAPVTAANFLHYVDTKHLDGATFYRAMQLGPGSGLVQGGVRDARLLYPPIAHEATTQTGLRHVDGAISLARGAPGTGAADFFIMVGPIPGFDADSAQPGDNQGYAVFGHVVAGMDVVRAIFGMPTSPTEGEGVMRGQMLAAPVTIMSARRIP